MNANRIIKAIYLRLLRHKIEHVDIADKEKVRELLSRLYKLKTGQNLDWNGDKYTEKMQRYKLSLEGKGYGIYVDKIEVRNYIANTIGSQYLIPILKIWDNEENINFDSLPDSFVIKSNHGAGMNIIVKNKNKIDLALLRKETKKWMVTNYSYQNGFEYQYSEVIPKIYAEEFVSDSNGGMLEIKFMCFNGRPYFCIAEKDRFGDHRRNIYDTEWQLQKWNIGGFSNFDESLEKPKCFEEAKELSKILSKNFSHARIDFYVINNQLKFGEITLTSGSGFSMPTTDEANLMLGRLWNI